MPSICSSARFNSDVPEWPRSPLALAWRHRATVVPFVALAVTLAGLAGGLCYLLGPTDVERAEADLQKARAVVIAFDEEAGVCLTAGKGHNRRAAEHQKQVDENPTETDAEWLEWQRSMAYGHAELARANYARRDTMTRLCAAYLRLLAEAEGEILRAKDARDRGTPYKVAPRVRELLTPMISAR
ncbi:MAG: hypothetical protein K2X87_30340 [Gemmataceae bacterium]|nr:hypothetical protein [Gemmataceae bacterium]